MLDGVLKKIESATNGGVALDKRRFGKIRDSLENIAGADDTCLEQPNSLALLLSPDAYFTYQMPIHLTNQLEISLRFHLTPLLSALIFEQCAGQNRVVTDLGDVARRDKQCKRIRARAPRNFMGNCGAFFILLSAG